MIFLLISFWVVSFSAFSVHFEDSFELENPDIGWTDALGFHNIVSAPGESRLTGISHPTTGTKVLKVAEDNNTAGVHLTLGGIPGLDMSVQARVFCEGNDGPSPKGGYQALVARASYMGTQNFVRLSWDPAHSEPGDTGDGWVKLQAYDGSTWDYLGIDFSQFGSQTQGYILNGTQWPSGWHFFKLSIEGHKVSAFIDNMDTPCTTGSLNITLREGLGGFYVYTNGDYAGYFDDFRMDVIPTPTPLPADFDILILNGEVYPDGLSGPVWKDIGINDDRITTMGSLSNKTAHHIIDAEGLMVVPGFIDAHTHADSGGALSDYIRQGVTTVVTGNCGGSPGVEDVKTYYDSLHGKLGPNYAGLAGHNSLRSAVGLGETTPTLTQMENMKYYLEKAMKDGAFGLSTGLIYYPGFNAATEEIIELAEIVSKHKGVYASHIRSECKFLIEAVQEAIRIGHEADCRVQISHVKCMGPLAWDKAGEILSLVDAANSSGDDISMDQYPYIASQTSLSVLFPDWALNDWSDALSNHRAELEEDVRALIAERGGSDKVYIISGSYQNQYLDDVAASLLKDPEDVLIDDIGPNGGSANFFSMQEEDVRALMPHPRLMVGSDGPTSSHPRGAGTFPRFWGCYARDLAMFSKREGVLKTSTLAAQQFRLLNLGRGALYPGYFADITIFNYDTIIDQATFEAPSLSPLGIRYVIVNGKIVINDGSYQAQYSGRVLLSPAPNQLTGWLFY